MFFVSGELRTIENAAIEVRFCSVDHIVCMNELREVMPAGVGQWQGNNIPPYLRQDVADARAFIQRSREPALVHMRIAGAFDRWLKMVSRWRKDSLHRGSARTRFSREFSRFCRTGRIVTGVICKAATVADDWLSVLCANRIHGFGPILFRPQLLFAAHAGQDRIVDVQSFGLNVHDLPRLEAAVGSGDAVEDA